MVPFLRSVAEAMLREHGTDLRTVAVVLPSRRAALYLRKHLADVAHATLWSPEIFTFPTFMERLSGLRLADELDLLFLLHEEHVKLAGAEAGSLHEFLQWGPTALRDMSEVDAHRVPLDRLYTDLRELEKVEEWSLRLDPLSAGQQRLLRYWALKRDLHHALTRRCLDRGVGTPGLVARQSIERLELDRTPLPWKAIWYTGLHILTGTEELVMQWSVSAGLARLAWDADTAYLEDTAQEAGEHLRRLIGKFGPGTIPATTLLREKPRRIDAVELPNAMAQVYHAAAMVHDLSQEERDVSAIVLADESLLMPLLQAMPDVGSLNVTMGLPLRGLPVQHLVEAFLDLLANHRDPAGFPKADLIALLRHPFLQRDRSGIVRSLSAAIEGSPHAFVPAAHLEELCSGAPDETRSFIHAIAARPGEGVAITGQCQELITWAKSCVTEDRFAEEQLYQMALLLARTGERLPHQAQTDPRSFRMVFTRILRRARLDLFGEPLTGLQIMGMLETRAVDHDRVIVIGASEGHLPSDTSAQSFIPWDVRRVFGLPLPGDAGSVSAYSFFRMLQRSTEVTLLNAVDRESGASDPSRYIRQLRHGREGFEHTTWSETVVDVPGSADRDGPAALVKSARVMVGLHALLERGLSLSALADHVNCPLDFQIRHVLGIGPVRTPAEKLGPDRLGSLIHRTLEGIYAPLQNSSDAADRLLETMPQVNDLLLATMRELAPLQDVPGGEQLLQLEMAHRSLRTFLRNDAERIEHDPGSRIMAVELPIEGMITLALGSGALEVRLTGRIDRVDVRQGVVTIIDYKSGRVRPGDLRLQAIDRRSVDRRNRYALQLLLYAACFLKDHPSINAVRAVVVPLQQPSRTQDSWLRIGGEDLLHREQLAAVDHLLHELLLEMLDPARPIVHDPGSEHCVFCPVKE